MPSKSVILSKQLTLCMMGVFVLWLTGCSTAAVDARLNFWKTETAKQLPIGSTKAQAEAFFALRGVELKCCVKAPPGPTFHYINERKVGHGFMIEYDVVVLVEMSSTDTVASVSVQRWGIGM